MSQEKFDTERFKVRDASSYDAVTASYDRFTERFTGPISRRLVELAELHAADHALDIGSGTGVVTFEAARVLGSEGRVVGLDRSEGMIAAAEAKVRERGFNGRVRFVKGDAEALDFSDASFDVVLSLFVIMHFPHPDLALAQIYRVLRPGGRLVIAFGSGPPLVSLATACHYLRRVPEIIDCLRGAWLSAPSFLDALVHTHLPEAGEPEESPLARSHRKRASLVSGMIRRAGFTSIRSRWQGHIGFLETAEEFWELQATYSSLARKRLTTAPAEKVAALKEEFFSTCRRVQQRNGRLAYPNAVRIITAQRPART